MRKKESKREPAKKKTPPFQKKGAVALCLALWLVLAPLPVYASADITTSLGTLRSLVGDFVTGIGAIITLYGIFEFGNAQQSQDGAAKTYALQRIGGGLIMLIAPQLLALFMG